MILRNVLDKQRRVGQSEKEQAKITQWEISGRQASSQESDDP